MDCSTSGVPVLCHLPEFAQTHVHWVGDAIQPSHPLSFPFSSSVYTNMDVVKQGLLHCRQILYLLNNQESPWMFITALFITAKIWKQLRYPSIGKWVNKLWYIQIMEYYSLLKRNDLSSHEKWRKFKCILLSERSQFGKATYYMNSTIWHSVKCKTMTINNKMISDY